ncbi:hypothetical protein A5756_06280 [Mycobacterium sp. 852002-53434_SCH5985345]|uniref:hypothetical protein n=1 Tax=Mycobacterium sp. 852002-53434_SCH5985345 TaxID=1834107 RepID=UPI000802515F|nr:hypothetical protein [Mycobacterium sp. 852002-53434_SCH5985345]OBF59247.1 hypothetical protein A5756_06280 [Mycobacterium sp. 852002-53434_SCH5985345]
MNTIPDPENHAGASEDDDDLTEDTGEPLDDRTGEQEPGAEQEPDAESVDPLDGADDDHPFSAEDYTAAAEELAQQAAGAQDGAAEGDGAEAPSALDDLDRDTLASMVGKLRRESADRRVALAAAEERLQAAAHRVGELQDALDARLRADAEALALGQRMVAPSELWLLADVHEVLADGADAVDPAKLAELVAARVPEHWKTPVPPMSWSRGLHSGATGIDTVPRPASWAQALHPEGR